MIVIILLGILVVAGQVKMILSGEEPPREDRYKHLR